MPKKLPEIRIKDAWLLRENASKHLHELWGKGKPLLADDEWMEKRVAEYNQAWKPYEHKILSGMCDILDLRFRQSIIDVYIAPWFQAFSDPMVIGVMQEPDEFIDIITHELLHRLLTDNTTIPYQTNILKPAWEKLFGAKHSFATLVHIPVHAVHQAIYLDILKEPERFKRDAEGCKNQTEWDATDYVKAWDYVEKHGYQTIIKKLKDSYVKLGESHHD